jgi:hypothetical protein
MMKEYGMFTDMGDDLINDFVLLARRYQLNDASVRLALEAFALNETFDEASDTVVRERVFAAVNVVTL